MKLATNYLGLKLPNPIIIGASPLADDPDVVRQLEDAGASAIVLRSLFEEQIEAEEMALDHHLESTAGSSAEASSYFMRHEEYVFSPEQYLHQIGYYKRIVSIPVIASLNGCRQGGWVEYARRFQAAGADAIELNLYQLATDPNRFAGEIEAEMLKNVKNVVQSVRIPVAVKISPFHTSPAQLVLAMERVGASGAVLFNRLYQPDISLEDLEVRPHLKLSESTDLFLRLRWLAIISPLKRGSLAASGGVHTVHDLVKALLAGADAVQLVSVVLKHGPRVVTRLLEGLAAWMTEHGYADIDELRGAMNLRRCPDPKGFERANYIRLLQTWRL